MKDFKRYEIILIFLALMLFAFSSFIYIQGIPLRKYLLGWDDGVTQEKVGAITLSSGMIRRKSADKGEFENLDADSQVYNLDTLVTGENTSATIQLDDGSILKLGPRTMIKLVFQSRMSLSGIERSATIDVITGEVTGTSVGKDILIRSKGETLAINKDSDKKLPVAPPPPPKTEVELISPKDDVVITVDRNQIPPKKTVTLTWRIKPPQAAMTAVIRKADKPDAPELFRQTVTAQNGKASLALILKEPGRFEWELLPVSETDPMPDGVTKAQFKLNPVFEAITAYDPLIAGQSGGSNAFTGKFITNFDLTLRWKPYPGVKNYTVQILKENAEAPPLLEKKTDTNSFTVPDSEIYAGKIFYRISATLPTGFTPTSGIKPFAFKFLPPVPMVPGDQDVIPIQAYTQKKKKVLFTWQKTNFTDAYELQISKTNDFTEIMTGSKTKENFLLQGIPQPGEYWWRVISIGKDVMSQPSQPRAFVIR